MSRASINRKLDETYSHIFPYISKKETPELFAMCERCERFCGKQHDFTECREEPCFKNWLGYEYMVWEDSWE